MSSVSSEAYADTDPFITVWKTTGADESITVPVGGAPGTYTVNWGDGTVSAGVTGDQTHRYAAAGNHTVSISGNFERIYLGGSSANAKKLQSVEQWGDIRWSTMNLAFHAALNMVYNAVDSPNLSSVTDMSGMFSSSSFSGDISGWDVSSVTDMSYMFLYSSFSGDLSGWDVSSVTDMSGMFRNSTFNGDLSGWDVSSVTDMSYMFWDASFNGDLSGWDVSSVTDMPDMLGRSPFNGDLSGWDVSSVTDMSDMLGSSSFNGDLSGWDVSSVTDMSGMFGGSPFDGNLGRWYITLDNTSIAGIPGTVGNIAAQNPVLDSQNPTYGIGSGADSALFEIDGDTLLIKPSAYYSGKTEYAVNITSTGDFGVNNFLIINVTVAGAGDADPN